MVPPAEPGDPASPSPEPDRPASPEDAHAQDEAWFPQSDGPSERVPPMVTISTATTPDLPVGGASWTGDRLPGEPPAPAAPGDDPDDWLVGDEDLAPVAAAPVVPAPAPAPAATPTVVVTPVTASAPAPVPATLAPPTLIVTPPSPKVLAPDPAGSLHRHRRRPSTERIVAWASALVGSGGILLGLMLALVNAEKWPASGVCTAYAKAHHGHGAFGCGGTQGLATVLPPIVTAVLVVAILAVVWIPQHTARRRLELIGGLAALLTATALVEALVYSALP